MVTPDARDVLFHQCLRPNCGRRIPEGGHCCFRCAQSGWNVETARLARERVVRELRKVESVIADYQEHIMQDPDMWIPELRGPLRKLRDNRKRLRRYLGVAT